MEAVIGILLLATLVEGLVEYVLGGEGTKPYRKYAALVLGVVLAIAYDVDIPTMAGLTTTLPFIGNVVSGIIIGRGSNYANDIISAFRGK
jgi:hypothetical protein